MSTAHPSPSTEHLDVLVVGAGISGIGVARYLGVEHPGRTYAVLEARGDLGGTWSLFRYPGVRSDSDLYTFGYDFKPWRDEASIADAPAILSYLREAVSENGIADHIRFRHRVLSARWSSHEATWTVLVERTDTGDRLTLTTTWLIGATGYYRYDEPYTPEFAGRDQFEGTIVHPQQWPEHLDVTGKRVVVIGSGATAVTLVPALARTAAHVTMLQRTPTYVMSRPRRDALAKVLTRALGPDRSFRIVRRKNIIAQRAGWVMARRFPNAFRKLLRRGAVRALPEGYDVDTHFNPPYAPWDQRLCVIPDGDLFEAISAGRASVVTDRVDSFAPHGIRTGSGEEIAADVVVTATGFTLLTFGGIEMTVDDDPVDPAETVAFKGMMLSGIPNFAFFVGYTNASWTLKVGLLAEHLCRLLFHMDEHGYAVCTPRLPDGGLGTRPLLDFGAGYVQRSLDSLPRQGDQEPWTMSMSYRVDERALRRQPVADPALHFERAPSSQVRSATA
ncbi:MAG: NAD(P)/FAD-dependent oxidoreductase [Ornithinibacter sp.]